MRFTTKKKQIIIDIQRIITCNRKKRKGRKVTIPSLFYKFLTNHKPNYNKYDSAYFYKNFF